MHDQREYQRELERNYHRFTDRLMPLITKQNHLTGTIKRCGGRREGSRVPKSASSHSIRNSETLQILEGQYHYSPYHKKLLKSSNIIRNSETLQNLEVQYLYPTDSLMPLLSNHEDLRAVVSETLCRFQKVNTTTSLTLLSPRWDHKKVLKSSNIMRNIETLQNLEVQSRGSIPLPHRGSHAPLVKPDYLVGSFGTITRMMTW